MEEKYKASLLWLQQYVQGCTVLHIGGHKGQEGKLYTQFCRDFLFVEPIPKFHKLLLKKGYKSLNVAISLLSGTNDFYVTEKSQRSSMKFPQEDVASIKKKIKVKSICLSEVKGSWDVLVIDAQGTTYDILLSGNLSVFKCIVCEASTTPRYSEEAEKDKIEKLLVEQGFEKIDEFQHKSKDIYDVVFERKNG